MTDADPRLEASQPIVLLVDPKKDYNVGAAVRAGAVFGAETVAWTGSRVVPGGPGGLPRGYRLPREERLRNYASVRKVPLGDDFGSAWRWLAGCVDRGYTPVAVEAREAAEPLDAFEHPESALYIFGPEDGTLGRGWLEACHRFVVIPTRIRSPLNLAAAVNVVLYDRFAKGRRPELGSLEYHELGRRPVA